MFARRAGPDGDDFLSAAFRTAHEHFSDTYLDRVPVPEAALQTGIDPAEVADDLDRTRREAREEHDAIFRQAFGERP